MQLRQSPSGPFVNLPGFPQEEPNVNNGAVASIDWQKGPAQRLTVSANCAVTMSGFVLGETAWSQLKVEQGGAGGFTPTFVGARTPASAPLVFSAGPGDIDLVSVYWDGAVAFVCIAGLDWGVPP